MYNLERGDKVLVSKGRIATYIEYDTKKRHHKINISGKIKLCPNTPKKLSEDEIKKYERSQPRKTNLRRDDISNMKEQYRILEKNRDKYKTEFFKQTKENTRLKEKIEQLEQDMKSLKRGKQNLEFELTKGSSTSVEKCKQHYERKLREKDLQMQESEQDLKEQISALSSQLKEKVGERDQSFSLAQDFEDQIIQLKSDLKVKSEVVKTHESNLKKLKSHEGEYEGLMNTLKAKVEKLRKENIALQEKNEELQKSGGTTDLAQKDALIDALQAEAGQLLKDMEVMEKEKEDLEAERKKLKDDLYTQTKKTSLLETQVTELRNAEAVKGKQGKDDSDIQAKVKTLTLQLSRREAEIKRLKKNIDDMTLRHARETSEIMKSNNELQGKADEEIVRLKNDIIELNDNQKKVVDGKVLELQRMLQEAESRASARNQENDILRQEQVRLQQIKEKLKKEQKSGVVEREAQTKEMSRWKEENAQLSSQLLQAQQNIENKDSEKSSLDATVSGLREKILQKEAEVREITSIKSTLKMKEDELKKKENALNSRQIESEQVLEKKLAEIEKNSKEKEEKLKEKEDKLVARENQISIEEATLLTRKSEVDMEISEKLKELQSKAKELSEGEKYLKEQETLLAEEKSKIEQSGSQVLKELEDKEAELEKLRAQLSEREVSLSQREESSFHLEELEKRKQDLDAREMQLNLKTAEFNKQCQEGDVATLRRSLEARRKVQDAQKVVIAQKLDEIRKAEASLQKRGELQELDQIIKLTQADFSSSMASKQAELEKKSEELLKKEESLREKESSLYDLEKDLGRQKQQLKQEKQEWEKAKETERNDLIEKGKILVQHEEQIEEKLKDSMTRESLIKENGNLNERVSSLSKQLSDLQCKEPSLEQEDWQEKLKEADFHSRTEEAKGKEAEKEYLRKEKEALEEQRNALGKEKEQLEMDQKSMEKENATVLQMKEKLGFEKEALLKEMEAFAAQKEENDNFAKTLSEREKTLNMKEKQVEDSESQNEAMMRDLLEKAQKLSKQEEEDSREASGNQAKDDFEEADDNQIHTVLQDFSEISKETQNQLQDYHSHLRTREDELSKKETEIELKEKALEVKEEELRKREAQVQKLKEQIEKDKKDSDAAAVMKTENEETKNAALESAISVERERAQELGEELSQKKAQVEGLLQEKTALEKDKRKLVADLESMRDMFNDAQREKIGLEDSVRRRSMEDSESSKKLRVKEEQVAILEQQLVAEKQEATSYREKFESAQMELVHLDTARTPNEGTRKRKLTFEGVEENSPKRVRLSPDAEWREEKGKYEQTISSLRQEIILIKTQFEANESESAAEFVSQLKAKFDTLQNQLASTTTKYEEMKSKYANLESVKQEYEASASEREVVNKEADSLRQEIAELREKFKKTEKMVLEKNDEIARFARAKEDEEDEVRKQFGDESLVGLGRVELMRNICTLRDELACAKSFYQQASSQKENKQIKQEQIASPIVENQESDQEYPLSQLLTKLLKTVCTREVQKLNETLADELKNVLAIDIWDVLVCTGPQIRNYGKKLSNGKYLFFDQMTRDCLEVLSRTWDLAFIKKNDTKLLREALEAIDPAGNLDVEFLSMGDLKKRERTSSNSKSITLLTSSPPKQSTAWLEVFVMAHYCLRKPLKTAELHWLIPENLGFRRATNMLQHLSCETQVDRICLLNNFWIRINRLLFENYRICITGFRSNRGKGIIKKIGNRLRQMVEFYGAEIVEEENSQKANYIVVVDEYPRTLRKSSKAEVVTKSWLYACIDAYDRDQNCDDYRPEGYKKQPKSPGIFKRTRLQRNSWEGNQN